MEHLGKWRVLLLIVPFVVICLALWADADDGSQPTGDDAGGRQLVRRAYPIEDIVLGAHRRDYPPPVTYIESSDDTFPCATGNPNPDFFDDHGANELTTQELITNIVELIQGSIDIYSWDGDSSIREHGLTLYIFQTPENHEEIAALLAGMRENVNSWPAITTNVQWIVLPIERYVDLISNAAGGPVRLADDLPEGGEILYAGNLTCRDGQATQLRCGDLRSYVKYIEPIISENAAPFRPIIDFVVVGASLNAWQRYVASQDAVVLDVVSVVTKPLEWEQSEITPSATVEAGEQAQAVIDLPRYLVHELMTTVRVPLDTPILVGAMSNPTEDGPGDEVLCLVVQVSVPPPYRGSRRVEQQSEVNPTPPSCCFGG